MRKVLNIFNRNRFNILVFGAFFVMGAATYFIFLWPHFSVDSYGLVFHQEILIVQSSASGRPFSAILTYLFSLAGFNLVKNGLAVTILAIALFAVAVTMLAKMFWRKDWANNHMSLILFFASILLVVNNVFSAEFFYFNFNLIFYALSLIFSLLAVKKTIYNIENGWKLKSVVVVFFYLLSGLFLYQSWPAIFWPLVLILVVIRQGKPQGFRLHCRRLSIAGIIYLMAGVGDYLYIRIAHPILFPYAIDMRTASFNVWNNFATIWHYQGNLWLKMMGIMPPYIFFLSVVFIILMAAFFVFKPIISKNKFFLLLMVLLSLVVVSQFPLVFMSNAWINPRSMVLFAAIPGLLILFLLPDISKSKPIHRSFFLGIALALLVVYGVSITRLGSDTITVNSIDRVVANEWAGQIIKYEQESHKIIKHLYFHLDSRPTPYYDGLVAFGDMNAKATYTSWSRGPLLALALGRGLDMGEEKSILLDFKYNNPLTRKINYKITELYAKSDQEVSAKQMSDLDYGRFFEKDKNWNQFSSEQVILRDDSAYIVVY